MNAPEFEPVLFVQGYWDQPRGGIALFHGVPYRFYCPFDDEIDDYSIDYWLAPLSAEALQLEREAFDIYYGHGPTPELPSLLPKPIPRFPDAEPRFNEIQEMLKEDRDVLARATIHAMAKFKRRESYPVDWNGRQLWQVKWEPLNDAKQA